MTKMEKGDPDPRTGEQIGFIRNSELSADMNHALMSIGRVASDYIYYHSAQIVGKMDGFDGPDEQTVNELKFRAIHEMTAQLMLRLAFDYLKQFHFSKIATYRKTVNPDVDLKIVADYGYNMMVESIDKLAFVFNEHSQTMGEYFTHFMKEMMNTEWKPPKSSITSASQ